MLRFPTSLKMEGILSHNGSQGGTRQVIQAQKARIPRGQRSQLEGSRCRVAHTAGATGLASIFLSPLEGSVG